jgi:hypothetical protein
VPRLFLSRNIERGHAPRQVSYMSTRLQGEHVQLLRGAFARGSVVWLCDNVGRSRDLAGTTSLLRALQLAGRVLVAVRQAFPSWMRSIWTEIYLCRTCSCHEILRAETPGQVGRDEVRALREEVFVGWRSLQLECCCSDMHRACGRSRLPASKVPLFEKVVAKPVVAAFGSLPLTLSVVIELVNAGKLTEANASCRSYLYEQAVCAWLRSCTCA